jgi:hypothetical protein
VEFFKTFTIEMERPEGSSTFKNLTLASPFVNHSLLWLQATCQLFAVFHLPSGRLLPSIQIESRPAELVMAVTDF